MNLLSDLVWGPEQKKEKSENEKLAGPFSKGSQISRPDILREFKSPAFLRQIGAEYKLDGAYKRALTPQDIDRIIDTMLPTEYGGNISKDEVASATKRLAKEIYQMQRDRKPTLEIVAKQEALRFLKTVFGLQ